MKDEKYLLSFELSQENDELDIHFTDAGIERLMNLLSTMLSTDNNCHEHLFSHAWGGDELSEDKQCENSNILNKVTFHKWK